MTKNSKRLRPVNQTDQTSPTDDPHINEEDKQELKASDQAEREMNPGKQSRVPAPKSVLDGKRRRN